MPAGLASVVFATVFLISSSPSEKPSPGSGAAYTRVAPFCPRPSCAGHPFFPPPELRPKVSLLLASPYHRYNLPGEAECLFPLSQSCSSLSQSQNYSFFGIQLLSVSLIRRKTYPETESLANPEKKKKRLEGKGSSGRENSISF